MLFSGMSGLAPAAMAGYAAIAALNPGQAQAHDAASGWTYPYECCSDQDCRPIAESAVREGHDGYLIHSSGEVVVYSDARVRRSPDGVWHWCSNGGRANGRTICLFVPPKLF